MHRMLRTADLWRDEAPLMLSGAPSCRWAVQSSAPARPSEVGIDRVVHRARRERELPDLRSNRAEQGQNRVNLAKEVALTTLDQFGSTRSQHEGHVCGHIQQSTALKF